MVPDFSFWYLEVFRHSIDAFHEKHVSVSREPHAAQYRDCTCLGCKSIQPRNFRHTLELPCDAGHVYVYGNSSECSSTSLYNSSLFMAEDTMGWIDATGPGNRLICSSHPILRSSIFRESDELPFLARTKRGFV